MKQDLVIIGGGIIGLYSAYLLTRRGMTITLIDKGDFGRESSWVAGGILTPLLPWHYSEEVFSLTANASEDYFNLSNNLSALTNIDIEYWKCGLTIQQTCDQQITRWCSKHKLTCTQSSHPQPSDFHLPDIAQVRMPMVISALKDYLRQNNVTMLSHTLVNDYLIQEHRMLAVNTTMGVIHADHFLLATGAWLPEITSLNKNICVPTITPIKGQVIAFQATPGLLNHILYKDGYYLIPRKDGLIIAGSTIEDVGYNKQITDSARHSLWLNAVAMLPQLKNYSISHHWAGLRPGSKGNIPTIGPHPEIKGLYLNCDHFRYGVAMAPKSSHIISQWILNKGDSLDQEERSYAHNFA